jgi:hypothetical protein
MKKYNLIAIAALLALAAGPAGAQPYNPAEGQIAYRDDGTPVILPPKDGAVLLPEISTGTASPIAAVLLIASLVDGADKPFYPAQFLQWQAGVWKDKNAKVLTRVMFPLRDRLNTNDPKFRYKLEYKVRYQKGVEEESVDYMPLLDGVNFWLPAAFPFSWLNIDAGKLKWADSGADGLRSVPWTIKSKSGSKVRTKKSGFFHAKSSGLDGLWVAKDEELSAEINFTCFSSSRASKIPWADNGKDPRKLPSGPDIVLAQPACPK